MPDIIIGRYHFTAPAAGGDARPLVRMREAFVRSIWRRRLAWIREGLDQLGAAVDRVWPA